MSGILLLCGFLFYAFYFGRNPASLTSGLGIYGIFLTIVLPVYIIAQMKLNYKTVYIDTQLKEISFKMFVLQITKTYPFEYFDGYVDTIVKDKYGEYKCYYLVKDNKLKYKMSGRFYSNIEELYNGISTLSYKGFIKFTVPLSIKIALNKEVV
jgi:hypothetical protein